jgi:hypothetical protein
LKEVPQALRRTKSLCRSTPGATLNLLRNTHGLITEVNSGGSAGVARSRTAALASASTVVAAVTSLHFNVVRLELAAVQNGLMGRPPAKLQCKRFSPGLSVARLWMFKLGSISASFHGGVVAHCLRAAPRHYEWRLCGYSGGGRVRGVDWRHCCQDYWALAAETAPTVAKDDKLRSAKYWRIRPTKRA